MYIILYICIYIYVYVYLCMYIYMMGSTLTRVGVSQNRTPKPFPRKKYQFTGGPNDFHRCQETIDVFNISK